MSDLKDNLDTTVEKVEDLESVRIAQEDPRRRVWWSRGSPEVGEEAFAQARCPDVHFGDHIHSELCGFLVSSASCLPRKLTEVTVDRS